MADGISIEVQNLQTVITQLKNLGCPEDNKHLKTGLRKGGQYLRGKLKANLRAEHIGTVTGNLQKAPTVKVKRQNRGVLVGFARPTGNHAHLLDQGHEIVDNRSGHAIHTGMRTKPRPFREKTLQEVPQAARIATDGIVDMINQYK